MKTHQIAAIVLILALTASGYALMVWQHTTLSHGEEHHEETSDSHNNATSGSHESSQSNDHSNTVIGSSVTGTGATGRPQTGAQTGEHSSASSAADSHEPLPDITLTVLTERVEQGETPLVTIQLQVAEHELDLSGWRLGDDIGVAGHPDHLFYFGNLTLPAGDTLTIHSSCGRDEGLTLYWCLTQPLTLLDSVRKDLYLLNQQGEAIVLCRPTFADEQTLSTKYDCA